VPCPESLHDVRVATVQCPPEKHDKQERRYHHLAACHFQNKAIKMGAECQNWFVFALKLVKDWEEGGERVSNVIGMAVGVKSGQDLESTTIVNVAFIFKQKSQLAVFDGRALGLLAAF
jgi:hypothetical protein